MNLRTEHEDGAIATNTTIAHYQRAYVRLDPRDYASVFKKHGLAGGDMAGQATSPVRARFPDLTWSEYGAGPLRQKCGPLTMLFDPHAEKTL